MSDERCKECRTVDHKLSCSKRTDAQPKLPLEALPKACQAVRIVQNVLKDVYDGDRALEFLSDFGKVYEDSGREGYDLCTTDVERLIRNVREDAQRAVPDRDVCARWLDQLGYPTAAAFVRDGAGERQRPAEAKTTATIAADVLECAAAHEPDVRLIGNVRAEDVAALARAALRTAEATPAPWTDDHHNAQAWLANNVSRAFAMNASNVDSLVKLFARRDAERAASHIGSPEEQAVSEVPAEPQSHSDGDVYIRDPSGSGMLARLPRRESAKLNEGKG